MNAPDFQSLGEIVQQAVVESAAVRGAVYAPGKNFPMLSWREGATAVMGDHLREPLACWFRDQLATPEFEAAAEGALIAGIRQNQTANQIVVHLLGLMIFHACGLVEDENSTGGRGDAETRG